jgi:hypothetical protein
VDEIRDGLGFRIILLDGKAYFDGGCTMRSGRVAPCTMFR